VEGSAAHWVKDGYCPVHLLPGTQSEFEKQKPPYWQINRE